MTAGYLDAYYTYLNPCLLYYTNAAGQCVPSAGRSTSRVSAASRTSSELPKTPKNKFTFSPTYDFHLPNDGTMRFQADYTYVAHMFNDGPNTVLLERDSTNTVNAAIHYIPPSRQYEFIVGGTNLPNDRYITVGSTNYTAGEVVASYNPPRMWYCHDQRQDAVTIAMSSPSRGAVQSLESLLNGAGSIVEFLRNQQAGPNVYPGVPAEYTNWRDEQRAWAEPASCSTSPTTWLSSWWRDRMRSSF